MKSFAIIPARYASTRFPGKPLALLAGRPVVQHVVERTREVFGEYTFVATDDERIAEAVRGFGGKVILTRADHPSGTDRIREAYEHIGEEADVVVNVQGDEPFIHPEQLRALLRCFEQDATTQIATLVKPFAADVPWHVLENPNSPKVVVAADGTALYFSRSVIPYLRGEEREVWMRHHRYLKHIGLYAYRPDVLRQITEMPRGELERCESLEQLRWLEAGLRVRTAETLLETVGIDTPDDLARAEAFLASDELRVKS